MFSAIYVLLGGFIWGGVGGGYAEISQSWLRQTTAACVYQRQSNRKMTRILLTLLGIYYEALNSLFY